LALSPHKGQPPAQALTHQPSLLIPGYQIDQMLNSGGMGKIYLGHQKSLERKVAIKVFDRSLLTEVPQLQENFIQEALIISQLNHPNIVQVIDRGQSGEELWFVMEFIEGVHLGKAITLDRLNLSQKYKVALEICSAIDYAHKNNILHRDIKPENILINMHCQVKVLDFGIASDTSQLAGNNLVAGTWRYMAPELINQSDKPSVQSDIFSLGLVLHELFSGAPTGSETHRHYQSLQITHPETPELVDKCIESCINSNPALRPGTVQEIYLTLLQASHGTHIEKSKRQRAGENFGKRDFELLEVLSEKESHSTYLFADKNSKQKVVLKKYSEAPAAYAVSKKLQQTSHNNLVPILGVSENKKNCAVIEGFMAGGSMSQRQLRPLSIQAFIEQAKQICDVMAELDKKGIYHGNLNAKSVYYSAYNKINLSGFSLYGDNKETRRQYRGNDISGGLNLFYSMLSGKKIDKVDKKSLKHLPDTLQTLFTEMKRNPQKKTWQEIHQALQKLQQDMSTQVISGTIENNEPSWHKWAGLIELVGVALIAAVWHFYLRP